MTITLKRLEEFLHTWTPTISKKGARYLHVKINLTGHLEGWFSSSPDDCDIEIPLIKRSDGAYRIDSDSNIKVKRKGIQISS